MYRRIRWATVLLAAAALWMAGTSHVRAADDTTLTIRVVQQGTSATIAGASVTVVKHPQAGNTPAYDQTLTTNANGIAVFSGVVPNGIYNARPAKDGCRAGSTQTVIIPNNRPGQATLPLRCSSTARTSTLTVNVRQKGQGNAMIPGATVKVVKHQQSASTPAFNQTKTTNAQGVAVFSDVVPNGIYNVTVSKKGCKSGNQSGPFTVVIPNNTGATANMDLDCRPQRPKRGLLVMVAQMGSYNTANMGAWISGATVLVKKHPQSQSTPDYSRTATTDAEGRAFFPDVAPNGMYNVTVKKNRCGPGNMSGPVTVVIPNNVGAIQYMDLRCRRGG